MVKQIKWLKIAFLLGIITDALALAPMLYPPMAKFMWGFDQFNTNYFFAMGYGASLMTGWTLLLVWAYKKPVERKFIALLTVVVIIGLIITEIYTIANGTINLKKMIPTWVIQMVLIGLFSYSYLITKKEEMLETKKH
jgi:peptidoglycan/LPS O-acetylase OafA/YrhL